MFAKLLERSYRVRSYFSYSIQFISHNIGNIFKGRGMDKRRTIAAMNPTLLLHRTSADPCSHLPAICIVLLMFIVVAGCTHEIVVPQALTGKWKTSAPGYADRYMIFTIDALIYGIGNGKEISHRIHEIESERLGQRTRYTFYYREADGDKASLSFTYRPDAGGTIQFKNDIKIWEKAAL